MGGGDSSRRDPLIGRVLGAKFQVTELLGAGSMGKVYRAEHTALDKVVAIKVLNASALSDASLGARFKTEARAASRLDHPNSVQIFDFGEDGPLLYIAMELLEGENLGDVLKRERRLTVERSIAILSDVLAALSAAHRSGVVHRDLKPANIMLVKRHDDEGRLVDFVKVCDFGIAKVLTVEGDAEATALALTRDGAVFGTPAFMSPEQAKGEKVDARTDLFSCGVILYKMISGTIPFRAQTAPEMLAKLVAAPPDPLTLHVPDVDPRLAELVTRALAKERGQRFQSAQEMRAALRDLQAPRAELGGGALAEDLEATHALASPHPPTRSPSGFVASRPVTTPPAPRGLTTSPRAQAADATMRLPPRDRSIPPASRKLTGTIAPLSASPPRSSRRVALGAGALTVAGLAGLAGWLVVRARRDPLPHLRELLAGGNYGVAESYFLEHYDDLEASAEGMALARDALRLRRNAEDYAGASFAFDPSYRLAPSTWQGETTFEESRATHKFVLTISRVVDAAFAGTLDWPNRQITTRVRGIHDGNHVVWWDDQLLGTPSREARAYTLKNKINMMIVGEKMLSTEARPPDKLEATLVK